MKGEDVLDKKLEDLGLRHLCFSLDMYLWPQFLHLQGGGRVRGGVGGGGGRRRDEGEE